MGSWNTDRTDNRIVDLFCGAGGLAIQTVSSWPTATDMTLAGIALIIAAVAKLVKEASEAVVRLRPPR